MDWYLKSIDTSSSGTTVIPNQERERESLIQLLNGRLGPEHWPAFCRPHPT